MPRPRDGSKEDIMEQEKWYLTSPTPQAAHISSACPSRTRCRRPPPSTQEHETDPSVAPSPRDAWHAHTDLSRTEAKRQYIATLIATMHKYATTTAEARELVAELEFVWDQIKEQSGSSTSTTTKSSPVTGDVEARKRRRQMDSGGDVDEERERARADTAVGQVLRRLRPMSEADQEDELDEDEEEDAVDKAEAGEATDGILVAISKGTLEPNRAPPPELTDWDVRNRKWRRRMEAALLKLSVEVAALREQLEGRRRGGGFDTRSSQRRRGRRWGLLGGWAGWMLGAVVRHLVLDLVVVVALALWMRRYREDERVSKGLEDFVRWMTDSVRKRWRSLASSQRWDGWMFR